MGVSIRTRLSEENESFWEQRFGNLRSGIYIYLEALPLLLEQAWEDLQKGNGHRWVKALNRAIVHLEDNPDEIFTLKFDGVEVKKLLHPQTRESFDSLDVFDKAAFEFRLAQHIRDAQVKSSTAYNNVSIEPPQADKAWKEHDFRMSDQAAETIRVFYPYGRYSCNAADAVCLLWQGWYRQSLSEVDPQTRELAAHLLKNEAVSTPILAGHILGHRLDIIPDPPSVKPSRFQCFCLEVEVMNPEKKLKAVIAAPKVPKQTAEAFKEVFPTRTGGFQLAVAAFPRIFDQMVSTEIEPFFTPSDFGELAEAAHASGADLCKEATVGHMILWVSQQSEVGRELAKRVKKLSAGAKVCLEILVAAREEESDC